MLGFLKSFSSNIHYKYSVQTRPSFETGCWTVYDAKHKTTGDPVSVFVFSKKAAAEVLTNNGLRPRSAVLAEVWEFATRGVQQLTKIRHPAVLKLVEPLESTKSSMSFVTERVVGTVFSVREADLDELSVVRGLTTVVQALQFLHSQLGVVHGNISPQTVFADLQGDWKLAGLEFVVNFEEFAPGSYHLPLLDPRMPSYMHPAYDYLAPELVLNKTILPANDVWSLACLLFAIYLRRSPLQTRSNPSAYKEELAKFRSKIGSPTTTSKFPSNLQPYLASLFCEDPDGRMSLSVLETTDFFQNPLIKALKSMDEYAAKPVEEKVGFLKHFQTLIPQFPKQMRIRKIVKFATKELSGPRDPATGLLMGNVLFAVCTDMSKLSFQEQVLPLFTQLADYFPFQESVAANLEVIARNTSDKDFSKSVLPLLAETLKFHDAQHVPLQARVLTQTEVYAANLTVSKLEQTLFPAIIDCFAATPARQIKIASTGSLGVLVHRGVSKALIMDRLIPALQAMKTRDPAVVVAVAKLWKEVSERLNVQQIFTLALPHLLDMSLAKQLTVDQFKQFMAIIREQVDAVEKEQVKTLVHNQPHEEDDWLNNDPVTYTGAQDASNPAKADASQPISAAPLTPNPLTPNPLTTSPLTAAPLTATPFTKTPSSTAATASPLSPTARKPSAPLISGPPVTSSPSQLVQPKKPKQHTQQLPELPAPKMTPTSTAFATPGLHTTADKPQASLMAPLVPSNNAKPNDLASPLASFAPLQPQNPRKPSQPLNDDFGNFMSSPVVGNTGSKDNQFDSLI